MRVSGPIQNTREDCERVLRSLPDWFGIESALVEYAEAADRLPTFCATSGDEFVGFITLESHSPSEWEVHCIAVRDGFRGLGIGSALMSAAEAWMRKRGARYVLVKTLGESHPSPAYKESRAFYQSRGFVAEKIIPDIWGPSNPCLQMRKEIQYG